MKNLSFFKGLLIGGVLSFSIWAIAISAVSTFIDVFDVPKKEVVQSKIYATNPPS